MPLVASVVGITLVSIIGMVWWLRQTRLEIQLYARFVDEEDIPRPEIEGTDVTDMWRTAVLLIVLLETWTGLASWAYDVWHYTLQYL